MFDLRFGSSENCSGWLPKNQRSVPPLLLFLPSWQDCNTAESPANRVTRAKPQVAESTTLPVLATHRSINAVESELFGVPALPFAEKA